RIRAMPPAPIADPIASTSTSSRMIARQMMTTPSAGSVSRPENGGAMTAPIVNTMMTSPSTRMNHRWLNRPGRRGSENFSNQRMRRLMNGTAFPVIDAPTSRFATRSERHHADRASRDPLPQPQRLPPHHHLEREEDRDQLEDVRDTAGRDRQRGKEHQQ